MAPECYDYRRLDRGRGVSFRSTNEREQVAEFSFVECLYSYLHAKHMHYLDQLEPCADRTSSNSGAGHDALARNVTFDGPKFWPLGRGFESGLTDCHDGTKHVLTWERASGP